MISFDLTGKVAVVTGASSGLGEQFAKALSEQGCDVAVLARRVGRLEELSKKLKENGHDCLPVACDVTNEESIKEAVKKIEEHYGHIDILVNNAGITRDQLILRMKTEDFDAVINTNLKGTYLCMKQASRLMMKQKSGHIISLSSVVGVIGNAGQVNYAASKAGVIGMTMSLARELGPRGVTVNAVAPGFIETDMTEVLSDEVKEGLKASIPLGTLGHVEDVAKTIAFLASDDAKYITGQTIHVDGGMAM